MSMKARTTSRAIAVCIGLLAVTSPTLARAQALPKLKDAYRAAKAVEAAATVYAEPAHMQKLVSDLGTELLMAEDVATTNAEKQAIAAFREAHRIYAESVPHLSAGKRWEEGARSAARTGSVSGELGVAITRAEVGSRIGMMSAELSEAKGKWDEAVYHVAVGTARYLGKPLPPKPIAPVTPPPAAPATHEGWLGLTYGTSTEAVRAVLGEPRRMRATSESNFRWEYGETSETGWLVFSGGWLSGWNVMTGAFMPATEPPAGLAPWRSLTFGVPEAQVRELLGEPSEISTFMGGARPLVDWTYRTDIGEGSVSFAAGRVTGWTEPVR